jgi:hypothetical protein
MGKTTIDYSRCDARRDKKALSIRLNLQELEYMKGEIKKQKREEKKNEGGKVKDESKDREEGRKKARKTKRQEDIDQENIRAKDEPSWYDMTPKEEQGRLEEIRGRSNEQRDEDKRKLRTATVPEITRRIVELLLQLCRSIGEEWNREYIELVTTQLEKSQDPNELVTALDRERERGETLDHGLQKSSW